MPATLFTNATVVLPDRLLARHAVRCRAGRIEAVGPADSLRPQPDDELIDAGGGYLAPGLIDLHIHGAGRFLTDDGPEALAGLADLLPRYGVTGFVPTVTPRPEGEDAAFVRSLARVQSESAGILALHLEGPFLKLAGALPPEAIGQSGRSGRDRAGSLIEAARPYPAVFSISPELDGACELIAMMTAEGAPAFITHTAADVKQTQSAIEAGARHATHFYDLFPAPAETDPGVRPCGAVEAILADERVSVDFILDGEHVERVAVQMALRCKGPDRVCLITDANVGAGLGPGRHQFGLNEIEFEYPGGPARMTENASVPGALAGSGLTLDHAVRNARALLGVDVATAIRMASANPARVLGLDGRKGRIATGCDADLVLLDETLMVRQTWVGGRRVYIRDGEQR